MIESLPTDPMVYVAGFAALFGALIYLLYYDGYIRENYRSVKWLRRMVFPHVARGLHKLDEMTGEDRLSHLYVMVNAPESQHILNIDTAGKSLDKSLNDIGQAYKKMHFRPEVILAGLAENDDGRKEVGNFILTAPSKNHPNAWGASIVYDVLVMLFTKYQLHIRLFHNEQKECIEVYAHYELNPYNPRYSRGHYEGDEYSTEKGKEMMVDMLDEFENRLPDGYIVEVTERKNR